MTSLSARLAVVLLGDRLGVVALRRRDVQAFVVEAEQAAHALRAELDQRGLRARSVALALPRSAVTVKPIDLPTVGGDLREMMRFELERHLPFAAEDAPFDVLPLPRSPAPQGAPAETPTARALVAAAERRVVDGALRLAEDAKLRPSSVTVASHGLLNLVTLPARGQIAWLHGAADRIELLLVEGRTLMLSRTLPPTDGVALAEQVQRSLPLARWTACSAVWVSGQGADALASPLGGLGAPVGAPPWSRWARARLGRLGDEGRGTFELGLGVAAGGRASALDLLPPALRPRRVTRGQVLAAAMVVLTLSLGAMALIVPGVRDRRDLARLEDRIARLGPEVRTVERTVEELERRRRLLTTIRDLQRENLNPLPVLRELTELLPADAWLTSVSLDAKGVELTGQASAASALIPLLENSPRFQRVEFASPVTRGRDREQFRIRAAWEAGTRPPPDPAPAPPARPAPARRGIRS